MKTPKEKAVGRQTGNNADSQRPTSVKEKDNHFFLCHHQALLPYTFSILPGSQEQVSKTFFFFLITLRDPVIGFGVICQRL